MLNLIMRVAQTLRRSYWRVVRPVTVGVKVALVKDGRVLLVKNRYDKWWYLPGGGVKRGESWEAAAARELREECGIKADQFKLVGIYSNFAEYKSDYIVLLAADPGDQVPRPGLEIDRLDFFRLDDLSGEVSPATRRRLHDAVSGGTVIDTW